MAIRWSCALSLAQQEVEDTVSRLPAHLRQHAAGLPVTYERVPNAAVLADGWEPDLLGLFVGRPWADEESGAVDVPAQILLFLENLWDFSEGEEAVFREEVRTTYLHELGHYLGLDEDDLADRGLD